MRTPLFSAFTARIIITWVIKISVMFSLLNIAKHDCGCEYNCTCKYLLASTVVLASSSKISEAWHNAQTQKKTDFIYHSYVAPIKSEFCWYNRPADRHLQFSNSIIKSNFLITHIFFGDRGSPENFQWGPGVPRKYIVIFNSYRYEFIKFIIRFGDQGSPKAQLF